mgnify:CR=1 FL=1
MKLGFCFQTSWFNGFNEEYGGFAAYIFAAKPPPSLEP